MNTSNAETLPNAFKYFLAIDRFRDAGSKLVQTKLGKTAPLLFDIRIWRVEASQNSVSKLYTIVWRKGLSGFCQLNNIHVDHLAGFQYRCS